jgi:DNA-binding transcriptional LysR family regulator
MDTTRLVAFLAVAEHGGFSKAGQVLGRTQPAVSQAVAALEQELGQRLFLREGRRVRLTAAGQILFEHARTAFDGLAAAERRLSALGELRAGELVLGTSDTIAYHALPPVLAAFRARHPELGLRIVNRPSPAIARAVAEREVDVGILVEPLPEPSRAEAALFAALGRERLRAHEDVAICPPGHALSARRRVSLTELAGQPLVLLDRSTAARDYVEGHFARLGVTPRVALEMNSLELVKRLVELGFGLSVVPRLAIQRELAEGRLHAIGVFQRSEFRQLSLVTHGRGPLTRAAEAFAAITRQLLGKRRA